MGAGAAFRRVEVTPKSAGPSLTLVTWFDTMPSGSLQGLVLGSQNLEAECTRLAAEGVTFDRPLERQPWGTEAVIFCDPDGNKLVLQQV